MQGSIRLLRIEVFADRQACLVQPGFGGLPVARPVPGSNSLPGCAAGRSPGSAWAARAARRPQHGAVPPDRNCGWAECLRCWHRRSRCVTRVSRVAFTLDDAEQPRRMGLEHAQVAKPAGNQAQALLRHDLGIVDVAVLFGVVAQTLARPGEHALQRGSAAVGCGREVVVVGERARCSLPLRSAEHAAVAPCLTVARGRGRGREGSRPRVLDMSDSSDPQPGGRKRFKRRICADQRG